MVCEVYSFHRIGSGTPGKKWRVYSVMRRRTRGENCLCYHRHSEHRLYLSPIQLTTCMKQKRGSINVRKEEELGFYI